VTPDLRAHLRALVLYHGSIRAAAHALGCHYSDLFRALSGERPRPSLLRALGWEAVTTYRPIAPPDRPDLQTQLREIQARIDAILHPDGS
jgi:hypothetical protein